jgi:chromosome segregation ATPase
MSGMGAVNLVAIEEYSELKQRHDFLRSQSDDLTRARAELISAIDEINQTSQKQFEVTFEQIKRTSSTRSRRCSAAGGRTSSSSRPRTSSRAASRSWPSRPARS